ncbi:hypothetical protein Hanom_Chr12g01137731 [Helianthus anomalus]
MLTKHITHIKTYTEHNRKHNLIHDRKHNQMRTKHTRRIKTNTEHIHIQKHILAYTTDVYQQNKSCNTEAPKATNKQTGTQVATLYTCEMVSVAYTHYSISRQQTQTQS